MSPETKTMSPLAAAADEIAWLQALHAIELCRQVAELAARVHRPGSSGLACSAVPLVEGVYPD
jgi:hypothetical protein